MKTFHQQMLNELACKAEASARQRAIYTFSGETQDTVQRMINCWTPEAYIRPHRHLYQTKPEVWVLLQGKLLVVEFDSIGRIENHALMSTSDHIVVEIDPKTWHTVIALEPQTLVYEIKDGPYNELKDKDFAPWAPFEHSLESRAYREYLLRELGYFSFAFRQEFWF
jgi:cupin fold WbuC family metalloprotein